MNHLLTVADAVATHARLQPHKIGARDSRRALTFAQWHERATRRFFLSSIQRSEI